MNTGDERFPKKARLLKQSEFDRVYHGDMFAADETLVIKAIGNDKNLTRLGLSVGRKVGNAVVRNKWKRTIREAFRRQRDKLPVGLDLVVRPRLGSHCEYKAVYESLAKLVAKVDRRIQKFSQNRAERKS